MTRLPLEDRAVAGLADGPQYEFNLVCPVPGCELQGVERHHLWRRSFLVGDYAWVTLPDGTVVGNLVMLCQQHHHMLTINAAWVKLEDGQFTWSDMIQPSQPLTWQPPVWRYEDELRHPDDSDAGSGVGVRDPDLRASDVAEDKTHYWNEHDLKPPHQVLADGSCPTCLRPLPVTREKKEGGRVRRTWSITVPKDEREDGAETLDTLLEEARKEMARAGLPYGSEDTVRFFVLAQALGLFVTHAQDVLA